MKTSDYWEIEVVARIKKVVTFDQKVSAQDAIDLYKDDLFYDVIDEEELETITVKIYEREKQ